MPYIPQDERRDLDPHITALAHHINSEGQLNYTITRLLHKKLVHWSERYATFNTLIGVLECVKHELYEQKVRPYEYRKREENGDVNA